MSKYWLVAKNTWAEVFTYRLNFVMWRVRIILQILTLYFLWFAIIPDRDQAVFGYSHSQILTYILGISVINSLVISSRSYGVGDEINQGNLSNFLIKPINYFLYWFSKDIGDKAMNLVFAVCEITILFIVLKPELFFQTNLFLIILTSAAIIIALIMYFFINFLLSLMGFWSGETWGPRFLFIIILNFASGGLFPLDILPEPIFEISQLLPFGYLLYFPLKVYLGVLVPQAIYSGILISLVWTVIFYLIVKFVWIRGLRVYTAYGR